MYSARLNQLGVDVSGCLHTTELKNRILAQFPDMQAHREGRDVLLAFKDDIAFAIKQSKSPSMIKHSMNVIKQAVNHLNPGQIPVVACDQPLYATAKLVQWNWPQTHGEDEFFIMFGGLHIEMAALKTLGDWLADSGWTAAITDANIASSGVADSLLAASHLSRT